MNMSPVHAQNRFGLGRRGDAALPSDPRAWLAAQLDGPDRALAEPAAEVAVGLVAWREDLKRGNDAISASRKILQDDTTALLNHAATTDQPFRERLAWFWANHFTVSIRRGAVVPLANAYLREAIRPHVTGRFADMLGAVIRHPAMLYYLDNAVSTGPDSRVGRRVGRGLNENLARECLELHTVTPASGYTQGDVTEFAKVLTGWSVALQADPPEALFRPNVHQPGAKMVMGQRIAEGREGLDQALGWLARHPSTLTNVATRLVRHFVADVPPAGAVARIVAVLRETDGDLKAASLALLDLPEAWQPFVKLRSPTDYVLAVVRALDLPAERRPMIRGALAGLGQLPFNAPLPNGWPDTAADWSGPEAMMRRIDWAYAMAARAARMDPMTLAEQAIGPLLTAETGRQIVGAGSRRDAMTILLSSPEFQRR